MFLEQRIHIFQSAAFSLGVKQPYHLCVQSQHHGKKKLGRGGKVTNRYANGIDREEEKVDSAAKLGNANGPYLSNDNATDRAARRSEIQTASAVRCWEDLPQTVSFSHQISFEDLAHLRAVHPSRRAES